MAFKPDRPMGFFDMCHLNPDTIRFAKLLRDGPPVDSIGEDWKADLSPEEIQVCTAAGRSVCEMCNVFGMHAM